MLPRGRRSGKLTFAEFLEDDCPKSKMDLERWIASTFGNFVIRTCLAIFLLGANFESGSVISSGGCSGSFSMATRNF